MSEMIERVARALCRRYEIDDGFSVEQADRAAAGEMYKNFLDAARDAIEAMRDSTLRMREAAGVVPISEHPGSYFRDVWHAMHGAALK